MIGIGVIIQSAARHAGIDESGRFHRDVMHGRDGAAQDDAGHQRRQPVGSATGSADDPGSGEYRHGRQYERGQQGKHKQAEIVTDDTVDAHGRHAGVVRGGASRKMAATLQPASARSKAPVRATAVLMLPLVMSLPLTMSAAPSPTTPSMIVPRMPIVADGVLIVTSLFLLMDPPTKRNTPFVALSAISPALRSGSPRSPCSKDFAQCCKT